MEICIMAWENCIPEKNERPVKIGELLQLVNTVYHSLLSKLIMEI